MISAVCGRAPPLLAPPKPSCVPPTPPEISQDLLSVMKTRGFSAAKPQMVQPSTMETANKDFIFHLVEPLQTSAAGDQGSTFLISLEPRRLRKGVRKLGEVCERLAHVEDEDILARIQTAL